MPVSENNWGKTSHGAGGASVAHWRQKVIISGHGRTDASRSRGLFGGGTTAVSQRYPAAAPDRRSGETGTARVWWTCRPRQSCLSGQAATDARWGMWFGAVIEGSRYQSENTRIRSGYL